MTLSLYDATNDTPIDLSAASGISVVISVPAAFSPTCTKQCVPAVFSSIEALTSAGADRVVIASCDPPFALKRWCEENGWKNSKVIFASDFGGFRLRSLTGILSDENGKTDLPQAVGGLLRRGCIVLKNGEPVWRRFEEDSTAHTLDEAELIAAVREARDS